MIRTISWAGAALAIWAGVAAAQQPPPRQDRPNDRTPVAPRQEVIGQGTQQQTTQQPTTADSRQPQTHRARSVLGTNVSIQGGLSIGRVEDIIFDDDGYVDYLIVLNQGKYVTVPWQAAKFNFEQRTATVNITQQQFQQVPTFTVQNWPTFDAAYQQRIYGFYGLTPHERRIERRIERRP
jgi:hypothetical protein